MTYNATKAVKVGGIVSILALALIGCGATATRSDNRTRGGERISARKVPCQEALRFIDQKQLPTGAEDASCVAQDGIDTLYDIRFRIDATALRRWLAAAYPDLELRQGCVEADADLCGVLALQPHAEGGATAVELTVHDQNNGRSLVHYRPFNT
ncbi:hypothetical protein [Streptomyces sp. NPDC048663]|uniref:hypothetical protein n=1 Tax=Streptomyces sp. NPDC048663 TaxID=3155638 RepID=UPI00341B9A84